MAFAIGGTVGAIVSKTAGTQVFLTATATIPVNTLVIVRIAKDNVNTTDGNFGEVLKVSDNSQTNVYFPAGEFTNGQGGAGSGATVACWFSILRTALPSSTGQITVDFNGSITSAAVDAIYYTIGAGNSARLVGTLQTLANDGVDAGSMTVGSLTSKQYLFTRVTAYEAAALTGTNTASWASQNSTAGTTGGGAATNIGVFGEYIILTGTTATSDPTTSAVDQASIMFAMEEYPIPSPPPVYPGRQYHPFLAR
jgi:hypothetical protein